MPINTILYFIFKLVLSDFNVARNSTVDYCGRRNLSDLIVDGDRAINNAERMYDSCHSNANINIYLETEYYIHYVIVYEGTFNLSFSTLDYFEVNLYGKNKESHFCSKYPTISIGPIYNKGMRVNCKAAQAVHVNLKSILNHGFSIAEVEVYTMFSEVSGKELHIYHGCFEQPPTFCSKHYYSQWPDCLKICRASNHTIAFFQGPTSCFCGELEEESKNLPTDRCDTVCYDHSCGGNEVFSAYIVRVQLPYHLGCFNDLTKFSDFTKATIPQCILQCANYVYAILLRGEDCVCSNTTNGYLWSDGNFCNLTCDKDDSKFCGGKDHASFYGVMSDRVRIKMLHLMRCFDGYDELGICQGGCKPGYVGEQCLHAEISFCEENNPCVNISNTICEIMGLSFTCECEIGFHRNGSSGPCYVTGSTIVSSSTRTITSTSKGTITSTSTGTSEHADSNTSTVQDKSSTAGTMTTNDTTEENVCISANPCTNISNTECVLIGTSFRCECKEGFFDSSEKCEDVNECNETVKEPCDPETSTCTNLEGSYFCECLETYTRLTEFICIKSEGGRFEISDVDSVLYFFVIPLVIITLLVIITWIFGISIRKTPSTTGSTVTVQI